MIALLVVLLVGMLLERVGYFVEACSSQWAYLDLTLGAVHGYVELYNLYAYIFYFAYSLFYQLSFSKIFLN